MKPKMLIKMTVDLVMAVLLLLLMAYMLVGEEVHEWLGLAMFLLFVLHHLLNWNWHRNLTKGRITGVRIVQTTVDFLLLLSMIGSMISGIMMSRTVFAFLPISGGMGFARTLHMLSAYWGFILMSIHIGLHWGMIMGMMRKMTGIKKTSAIRTNAARILALSVSVFGIYVFVKQDIASYLFLRNMFVFFDMGQPLAFFLAEYIAMMGMWACLGHYLAILLSKKGKRRSKSGGNVI